MLIGEVNYEIPLISYDKKTIVDSAKRFCESNAAILQIAPDALDKGCIQPVANHLFKEVYTDKMTEYVVQVGWSSLKPLTFHLICIDFWFQVTIPTQTGNFDLQFDLLTTNPRSVAKNFCYTKRDELNIAPEATEEEIEAACVASVENFIITDLTARGVLGTEDEVNEEQKLMESTLSSENSNVEVPAEAAAATETATETQSVTSEVPVENAAETNTAETEVTHEAPEKKDEVAVAATTEPVKAAEVEKQPEPVREQVVDTVGEAIRAAEPSPPTTAVPPRRKLSEGKAPVDVAPIREQ